MKLSINKKLQNYCHSERKKRKTLHYNYGTVCVGVEDSKGTYQVCSHSFKNDSSYYYRPNLYDDLNKLGTIGKTIIGNCVLGYCAEPHAANELLKRLNSNHSSRPVIRKTSNFRFTPALRIRTGQQVKYCKLCKKTFPQL